jgi:uncharacterized protein
MRMAFRLSPHERGFYPLFTRAAENIAAAAEGLAKVVAAEPAERPELAAHVKALENAGDDLTHEIFVKLNSTFVTPFDREDIYRLTAALDDVVDAIEAVADLFVLHRIEAPRPEMVAQIDVLVRAAIQTEQALGALQDMDRDKLEPYWIEINRLENEGDRLYRRAVADLFSGDHKAMDVLKWKEVIENLEEALDGLENVANIIESIILKHA